MPTAVLLGMLPKAGASSGAAACLGLLPASLPPARGAGKSQWGARGRQREGLRGKSAGCELRPMGWEPLWVLRS